MRDQGAANDQDAANTLLRMADLLPPHAIRVAATLELAEHLESGADTVPALAARTRSHPDVLGRLVRYLAALGVLDEVSAGTGESRYRLTELGRPLRRDHPHPVTALLSCTGLLGRSDLGLAGLLDSVRTGVPGYRSAFGREYWDDVDRDPASSAELRAGGPQPAGWDADVVVGSFDWAGVRHVTDVGGGTGALLVALLTAHPHLRGTVLDLPTTAAVAAERIERAGLAGRGDALAGNFFEPLPTGSDVYLLSGVLADWSDDYAVRILQRCREAAGDTGRVLLADISLVLPDSGPQAAALDLRLTSTVPAPRRTLAQLDRLVERSGLSPTWRAPGTPRRSLVELTGTGVGTGIGVRHRPGSVSGVSRSR